MKVLKFFEYGGYVDPAGNECDSLSECSLNKEELQYLRTLSETISPGKEIFEISSTKIRATSMVGAISFGGVHLEILPKLLRNKKAGTDTSTNSILKNLMFMLSYTSALEINDTGVGSLAQNFDSFIEAYISIFSDRLSKYLIRFGIPKAYVERCENLHTIKGKIAFGKQSSTNYFDQSKMFCEYSEFTEDNKVARAFKFVTSALARLTRNSASLSSLNRCLGLLDGVSPDYVNPDELDRMAIGKRDVNFLALMNLTKMFLKRLRPDFSGQRNNRVFALIFDMNELFEEFIYQVLKRNEGFLEIDVTAQKRKRLVSAERDFLDAGEWVDRMLFDTYTDISVKPKSGTAFIIDTKYKIVNSKRSHYGIGNPDVYQVLAYRQIHKDETGEPSVALLYPKSTEDLQKEFRINGSKATFMAWTIDISRDLKNSMPSVLEDLSIFIAWATSHEKAAA